MAKDISIENEPFGFLRDILDDQIATDVKRCEQEESAMNVLADVAGECSQSGLKTPDISVQCLATSKKPMLNSSQNKAESENSLIARNEVIPTTCDTNVTDATRLISGEKRKANIPMEENVKKLRLDMQKSQSNAEGSYKERLNDFIKKYMLRQSSRHKNFELHRPNDEHKVNTFDDIVCAKCGISVSDFTYEDFAHTDSEMDLSSKPECVDNLNAWPPTSADLAHEITWGSYNEEEELESSEYVALPRAPVEWDSYDPRNIILDWEGQKLIKTFLKNFVEEFFIFNRKKK